MTGGSPRIRLSLHGLAPLTPCRMTMCADKPSAFQNLRRQERVNQYVIYPMGREEPGT